MTEGNDVPPRRRRSARWIALLVLGLLALAPPAALAATTLPNPPVRLALPEFDLPNFDGEPGDGTPGTESPDARTTTPAPATSPSSQPTASVACGAPLAADGVEQQVVDWLTTNLDPRTAVLSNGSMYSRLCATWRPANLALRYEPQADGSDPADWSGDVVVSTPALREAVNRGDAALDLLPMLARFGSGPARIDVRQFAARSGTQQATRELLANDDRVLLRDDLRADALATGLDPRVLAVLDAYVSDGKRTVAIAEFPSTAPELAAGAPPRAVALESLRTPAPGSPEFAAEAERLRALTVNVLRGGWANGLSFDDGTAGSTAGDESASPTGEPASSEVSDSSGSSSPAPGALASGEATPGPATATSAAAALGQATAGPSALGAAPVGPMTAGPPATGQSSTGPPSLGSATNGQTTADQTAAGQAIAGPIPGGPVQIGGADGFTLAEEDVAGRRVLVLRFPLPVVSDGVRR